VAQVRHHRHRPTAPVTALVARRSPRIEALALTEPAALPRPRLLACDIDGTILDAGGSLRLSVRRAIARVAEAGVGVVLVTGRSPWRGVAPLASDLGLPGPHVTMQGALVSMPDTGAVCRVRALSPELYLEALRFASELGLDPVVALLDGHRAERLADGLDFVVPPDEGSGFRYAADLARLVDDGPIRLFLPTGPERHRSVRMAAQERFEGRASIVWSDSGGLEILAPGTNKGEAITWLAASRGIDLDEVAAVGDAANDVEMLRAAGRSAAMGTAPWDVRAAADIVVPSSDEDGLLEALAWFFPDLPLE
jgi:5-amino-6-(5-phospho-D-ribitylamino)uracil phosphatase